MSGVFEIREFDIVIVAKNHNPTILNPDFLKHNDILPEEWELSGPPICVEPMAQVAFKNKTKITAQLDKVIFFEDVAGKNFADFLVPQIATKYTETLPHVEYSAVGINPRGHFMFDGDYEAARKFILEKLVAPGRWREYGTKTVKATISFDYFLEKSTCRITIEEKLFRKRDNERVPVLVFSANFHRELPGDTRKRRLDALHAILLDWKTDLELYNSLVNDVFLSEGK